MRFTCVGIHFSVTSFLSRRIERLHDLNNAVDVAEVELVRNLSLEVVIIDTFFRIKMMFRANFVIGLLKFFFS